MKVVVSNATPLIALARIGLYGLLHDLYSEVLVTEAVVGEIEAGGEGAPGVLETREALREGWLPRCGRPCLCCGRGLPDRAAAG